MPSLQQPSGDGMGQDSAFRVLGITSLNKGLALNKGITPKIKVFNSKTWHSRPRQVNLEIKFNSKTWHSRPWQLKN